MDFMKSPLFAKAVKMAAGVAALSFLDPAVSAFARNVPIYNTLINAAAPILTPLLVKASPIFKPVYMLTDLLLGKKLRNEQRPSASAKPIVVFCSITVTNEAKYKAEFAKFAEALQKGAGVRAAFSFMVRRGLLNRLLPPADPCPPPRFAGHGQGPCCAAITNTKRRNFR